ncbi:MAG TPA: hypothetical protein VNJ01_09205 [Bacteriovoracaceae bacterium]|nr:hypothetical protein [Bacteriovoracaceae bacterium]
MMEINYKGGQPMPPYVIEALRYLGKVGVMSRPTWYQHFGTGTSQWKREQLLNLVNRGVLIRHSCNQLKGAWVLSDWSIDLLRDRGLSCVRPVPPHLLEHDEVVGTTLLALKKHGVCKDWLSERELKMMESKDFIVEKKENEIKYPDAVFKLIHEKNFWMVAIEYERTGKSTTRYRSILRQYGKLQNLNQILYVTEDSSIRKRIQGALKFIGNQELMGRIGLISACDWKRDPMAAPIYKVGKTTSFNQIFRMT